MGDVVTDLATRSVADPERTAVVLARTMAAVDRRRAARGLPEAQVLVRAPGWEFARSTSTTRSRGCSRSPSGAAHLGVTAAHAFPGRGIQLAMSFHSTREMVPSFRTHISLVQRVLRALEK